MLTISEIKELVDGKKLLELHGTIYECVGEKLSGQLIFQDVNSDLFYTLVPVNCFVAKTLMRFENK